MSCRTQSPRAPRPACCGGSSTCSVRTMDLYDAMRCAPTSRRFKPDRVPRELLVRALDSARFAPSGGNRQGWRVVVVEDPERRTALRELYLPRWRAYLEQTGGAK